MRRNLGLGAIALTVALGQGIVAAPRADGKPHEFEASAGTLKDLKLGDQIEAKRRPE